MTLLAIWLLIWFVLNIAILGLHLYLIWLKSKKHMESYEKRVKQIQNKYEKRKLKK